MSPHHCFAATMTPAMAATTGSAGLSSAPPFRLLGSSSNSGSGPVQLRLPPAAACRRRSLLRCAASGGGGGGDGAGAGGSDPALEEQRRRQAELAARIASGEFTVQGPGWIAPLVGRLSKLGPPGELAAALLTRLAGAGAARGGPEIPQALGSINAVVGQAFFVPLYDLFLTYGGIFRLNFGPKSFLIVSDPVIAKHILRDNSKAYSKGILAEILEFVMGKGLIPADGEIWRVRRRAIVPALHQKYVTAMISLFGEASDRLCQKLDKAASDGEDVEMESLFSRLTLDVIGKAVFNYDFDSLSYDNGIVEAVYVTLREAEMRSTSPIPTWEIPIWKDISPRQKKVNEALKLINTTLDELIAICKRLVEQEDLQFHEEYMNEQDPSILHFLLASGDDVSSKQLRDDLMTMLIAGHETSAAVLTWTFYLLTKYPKVMAKLQDEVDSVLGDGLPTIEDVKKLKYTTRVINESLRLYPQPPVLIRRSLEDDVLGGYPIGRGEDIFISVWNLHHCPKHWDDAEVFNPERWPLDGPNPNEINQNFSYLPFGGGPSEAMGTDDMPLIPALPVSARDAMEIHSGMGGAVAPAGWQGREDGPVYRLGPGPAVLNLTYLGNDTMATIENVFAIIEGAEEPDRYVILGNHRDAWTFGASDPNSGTAAMIELAQRFSMLQKQGWRPRRTIIFCSWDAEEYGLTGSTEWVEENREMLSSRAVAYLNIDVSVVGPGFLPSTTPQLDELLQEITKVVQDPDNSSQTVYDSWIKSNGSPRVLRLGDGGSDYLAFVQHAGIPSMNIVFGEGPGYPVYHSLYDDYVWMAKFGDPGFRRHVAAASIWGMMALRLADDEIIPFNYMSYAIELQAYTKVLENKVKGTDVTCSPLYNSIRALKTAATTVNNEQKELQKQLLSKQLNKDALKIRQLNDRLMQAERAFTSREGIFKQEWCKHLVYGPSDQNDWDTAVYPGIANAIGSARSSNTSESWKSVQHEIYRVARAVTQASAVLSGRLT